MKKGSGLGIALVRWCIYISLALFLGPRFCSADQRLAMGADPRSVLRGVCIVFKGSSRDFQGIFKGKVQPLPFFLHCWDTGGQGGFRMGGNGQAKTLYGYFVWNVSLLSNNWNRQLLALGHSGILYRGVALRITSEYICFQVKNNAR